MQTAIKHLISRQKNKQRVYIIPTRFGFVLALFLLVMLLGAINYSNNMAHLLVFLLVSLAHTAMLHTHRNIAKVELKYCHAEPVFAGQKAHFQVVLNNPSQWDLHQLHLAVRNNTEKGWKPLWFLNDFADKQTLALLPALQTASTVVTVNTSKRGYQSLESLCVNTEFPLGLFTSWMQFRTHARVLVYPRPTGSLPLPASPQQGEHFHICEQAGQDDFVGFNKYRPGDPIHSIAWKSLAKDDVLRTKQFNASQSYRCCLRWLDTSGDTEERLSQLCQWLLDAEQSGIVTRLELPDRFIDYGAGDAHLKTCLTALALYDG